MDEGEYRVTWQTVNERPCPFAKAILTRCCECSRARKLLIAEREAMICLSPAAHSRCTEVLPLLRHKALFALRLPRLDPQLPHGKEIKVQCGGLRGLATTLGEPDRIPDIADLLDRAGDRLENVSWEPVIQAITAWKVRGSGS